MVMPPIADVYEVKCSKCRWEGKFTARKEFPGQTTLSELLETLGLRIGSLPGVPCECPKCGSDEVERRKLPLIH